MAWNGTEIISGSNGSSIRVIWSVSGQSTQYNNTQISAKVVVAYPKQAETGVSYPMTAENYITTNATCVINGFSKSGAVKFHRALTGGTVISSISTTAQHNEDGTKSIPISVNYTITSGGGYYSASGSGTVWITLPPI